MSIYQDIILEHYRNPQCLGQLKKYSHQVDVNNPVCGDSIHLEILEENGIIKDIAFKGNGCAISQASASMFFSYVKGKTKKEVQKMDKDTILQLMGIELSAVRLKCALLSLEAVKKALL
jgi:nitrogen fixation NifU-like protein